MRAGRKVTSVAAPCASHGLGEAALLVPPDESSSAPRGTQGRREGFPCSSLVQTDCPGTGTETLLNA